MKQLLVSPGVRVQCKYNNLTPTESLVKSLKTENFESVMKCLKILLNYGALGNIIDFGDVKVLKKALKELNIKSAKKIELLDIIERKFSLIKDEMEFEDSFVFKKLKNYMLNEEWEHFTKSYNDPLLNISEYEKLKLFVMSVEFRSYKAFDIILEKGVDYNRKFKGISCIEIAWNCGNNYALEKLLQRPDTKLCFSEFKGKLLEFWKCFYKLLEEDKIHINIRSVLESEMLYLAIRNHDHKMVKDILKRGTCLTEELLINGISPSLLEEHLDDCITSNNKELGSNDFGIIMDFRNFKNNSCKTTLAAIDFMCKTKEYRYLLKHPILRSILYIKWHKLSLVFYINFILFLFFAISITLHIVLKFRKPDFYILKGISLYCSFLGLVYMILREFLQFLMVPLKYLKSFNNYLELLLILLSLTICNDWFINDLNLTLNIAVICLLLLSFEIYNLVGSLPNSSISMHSLMLQAVCRSFFKCFLLYSIFIFSFTLCFYIKWGSLNDSPNEEHFHKFSHLLVSFSKTIVMFAGEFDADHLNLYSEFSHILFLIFIFFISIILFNLLNGLAVSDTQAIKNQSELNDIICCCHLVCRYENLLLEIMHNSKIQQLLDGQPFHWLRFLVEKLFTICYTEDQIHIFPNNQNRVAVSDAHMYFYAFQDQDDDKVGNIYYSKETYEKWLRFLNKQYPQMDKRIVCQAIQILEKKSVQSWEQRLEEKMNRIIKHLGIENKEENVK